MTTAEDAHGPWEPLHCVKEVKKWENKTPEPTYSTFIDNIYSYEDIAIVNAYKMEFVEAMRTKFFHAYNPSNLEVIMKSLRKPKIRKEEEYIAYRNAVYKYFIKEEWTENETELDEYRKIIKADIMILNNTELEQYCKEKSIDIKEEECR